MAETEKAVKQKFIHPDVRHSWRYWSDEIEDTYGFTCSSCQKSDMRIAAYEGEVCPGRDRRKKTRRQE